MRRHGCLCTKWAWRAWHAQEPPEVAPDTSHSAVSPGAEPVLTCAVLSAGPDTNNKAAARILVANILSSLIEFHTVSVPSRLNFESFQFLKKKGV